MSSWRLSDARESPRTERKMNLFDPQSLLVSIDYMQANARPLDLAKLLVVGGAASKNRVPYGQFFEEHPEQLREDRISLLVKFKDHLETCAVRGDAAATNKNKVYAIRSFYIWGDQNNRNLTAKSAREDCIAYLRYLHERAYKHGTLKKSSARALASTLVPMLPGVLRTSALLRAAGFDRSSKLIKVLGARSDKQSLSEALQFIDFLECITSQLTHEKLIGNLPVAASLPDGNSIELLGTAPLRNFTNRKARGRSRPASFSPVDSRKAIEMRSGLINLCIELHMLYFIAITGMNLGQASSLQMHSARYQSGSDDRNTLRVYKNRRGGNVEFEIPRSYRPQLDAFLNFRREIFHLTTDAPELFLFVHRHNKSHRVGRSQKNGPAFTSTRKLCKLLGIPFLSPQRLRSTRANWFLRRSQDPDLTAELMQHTREVLLDTYADPNHQLTAVEIAKFHASTEVTIAAAITGTCEETSPEARPDAPECAPRPDCTSPAGCLFCSHYRGIESADYAWSLATYRYLKSIEICRAAARSQSLAAMTPAGAVVERVTDILNTLGRSSDACAAWVAEANAKVFEGNHHPDWLGFINLSEARA